MKKYSTRLKREQHTIHVMIGMYCQTHHHPTGDLCEQCEKLFRYAMERIDKCPFREHKPTCVKCPIHCYKPAMREQVRLVMRFAGPRMLFRHPLLAVLHLWDEISKSREC